VCCVVTGDQLTEAAPGLPSVDDGGGPPQLPHHPAAVQSQDHIRGMVIDRSIDGHNTPV